MRLYNDLWNHCCYLKYPHPGDIPAVHNVELGRSPWGWPGRFGRGTFIHPHSFIYLCSFKSSLQLWEVSEERKCISLCIYLNQEVLVIPCVPVTVECTVEFLEFSVSQIFVTQNVLLQISSVKRPWVVNCTYWSSECLQHLKRSQKTVASLFAV